MKGALLGARFFSRAIRDVPASVQLSQAGLLAILAVTDRIPFDRDPE
jgi:hypothetical protein